MRMCYAQVARMLIAVDTGKLHQFQGRTLDSIDVEGLFAAMLLYFRKYYHAVSRLLHVTNVDLIVLYIHLWTVSSHHDLESFSKHLSRLSLIFSSGGTLTTID